MVSASVTSSSETMPTSLDGLFADLRLAAVTFVCRLADIVSFDPQTSVLRVEGDEDRVTSGRRRRPLSAALTASVDIVVDLSELRFADSSLMVDLAVLAQRLRGDGRELLIRGPQPHIQKLIELVGLHRLPAVALA